MPRTAQKLQTRRKLVDAATYLFSNQGLASTRTVDVARKAGLSHGGVFVHFPTREKLIEEVVSRIGREITDRLYASISNNASLREVLQVHLECLAEHESTYTAFLRESCLLPRDVLRTWVGIQSAISVHMATAADKDIADGRVRNMPLHLMFNTWIGLVHHYLLNHELFAPGASVLKAHGAELIDHFTFLLEPQEEKQ